MSARHSVMYDVYMRSSLWRARRWLWFWFSDRRCEGCGVELALHRRSCRPDQRVLTVHHLTYARLGRERRQDVQLLCWRCHRIAQAQPLRTMVRVINGGAL